MNKIEQIRQLSARELALFGVQDIAYIKQVVIGEAFGYAVHTADGTQIAVFPDRAAAFAAVRQHDLEPMSVH